MASKTTNYELWMPESTDDFDDFLEEFNENMETIDENLGGGGGSGGHTIYDENGSAMTQRAGIEFTGSVSVSDDSVNDKTIVDILGGNVYGAFIDTDRVIKATTTISGETTVTYTATEDCVVTFTGVSDYEKACEVKIDNIRVWRNYNATNSGGIEANSTNLFLRKGQVISASNGSSQYNGNYTVYGIKQGSNGIFAPVIYSDTERVIGVWRDNKPLYQKTYSGLSLVCTNANQSYPTNVDWGDIEEVVHSDIIDQYGQSCAGSVVYTGTPAKLAVYLQMANRTVTDITIQYTKTTDNAGSGNWNTDEVPTEHCDNTEKVVGTWYGETLYERSFVYSGNISNRDWVTIDNSYSPSNVGVFFLEHICFKISGLDTLYASYMGQTLDVGVETAANLYVENYTGETVTDVWFTIRYTKVAD